MFTKRHRKESSHELNNIIIHNIPKLETNHISLTIKWVNESCVHTMAKEKGLLLQKHMVNTTNTDKYDKLFKQIRSQMYKNIYYVIPFVKYFKTGK